MFSSGKAAAVSSAANYIEDVFSTWLYTGNGSTQTITNGIDLSTKGGLVWLKNRGAVGKNQLYDTVRGTQLVLDSGATDAQSNYSPLGLSAFSTTGFSLGSGLSNNNTGTYASWTFRKQPKFFDVVTYTGNGVAGRTVSHNLGSVPGVMIVKCTDTAGEPWYVYHRSLGATKHLTLNSTNAVSTSDEPWYNTEPTATQFTLAQYNSANGSGKTYVAYLFAHNAGGFGLTGTDNVISCGSYTGNGSATGPVVTLGYEPQWVMIKSATTSATNWQLFDNMRGMPVGSADARLAPNLTSAEDTLEALSPTATGFDIATTSGNINTSGATYIYIAIRRGPMKVPTSGTSVFAPVANTTTYTTPNVIGSLNADWFFGRKITVDTNWFQSSKLSPKTMPFNSTSSEDATQYVTFTNTGVKWISTWDSTATTYRSYLFKRAPSFMDVVCYTGTGSARTVTHNLGVAPELMIVKQRTGSIRDWCVYNQTIGATNAVYLNLTDASSGTSIWNSTAPTSSVFSLAGLDAVNASGGTYVAYLFATCAGVSKVGSYTGTGTTLQVNCGFTAGARFVLIKRTDSTGAWYLWDSARGIVSGNDPYLLMNSAVAEVSNTDYVDTYSAGFEISSTAPAAINASGGTFIFLAIA